MKPTLIEIGWPDSALSHPEVAEVVRFSRRYRFGECTVICGREPASPGVELWHVSVSHPRRLPTWDEMHDVRYALVPDEVTMAMLLPPKSEYVNVHSNCLHLWEIP